MFVSSTFALSDYPFSFVEIPTQTISIRGTSTYTYLLREPYGENYSNTKTNAGSVSFIRPTSTSTASDATVSIQVIGRWK